MTFLNVARNYYKNLLLLLFKQHGQETLLRDLLNLMTIVLAYNITSMQKLKRINAMLSINAKQTILKRKLKKKTIGVCTT